MKKTIREIVDWIVQNRKGKAFENYSEHQIATELLNCSERNTMLLSIDKCGNIVGVVTAQAMTDKKIMFVWNILTIRKGICKEMLLEFFKIWPNYTLEGIKKHNKLRKFPDNNRLLAKL